MFKQQIDDALEALHAWAEDKPTNIYFDYDDPKDDLSERLQAPQPEAGVIPDWEIPPALTYALTIFSSAHISWGDSSGHEEFIILNAPGMRKYNKLLYVSGVSRGADGPELTCNHLVAFASGGDEESAFCFDVTQRRPDGEYPVYYSHQDEARWRILETGEWEDPKNAIPDFATFGEWLAWVANNLSNGVEPANSRPSAYEKMPGRS